MDAELVPVRSKNSVLSVLMDAKSITSQMIAWILPDFLQTRETVEEFLKNPRVDEINAHIENSGITPLKPNSRFMFRGDLTGLGRAEEFSITLSIACCLHEWDASFLRHISGNAPPANATAERLHFLAAIDSFTEGLGNMSGLPMDPVQAQVSQLSESLTTRGKLDTRQVSSRQQTKALVHLCWTIRERVLLVTEHEPQPMSWHHVFAFTGALLKHCNIAPGLSLNDESIRHRFVRATPKKTDDEMMEFLKEKYILNLDISHDSALDIASTLFQRFGENTEISPEVSDKIVPEDILKQLLKI